MLIEIADAFLRSNFPSNLSFWTSALKKGCICLCYELEFEKIGLGLNFYRTRRWNSSIDLPSKYSFCVSLPEKGCICICFEIDFEKIGLGLNFWRNCRWISSINFPSKLSFWVSLADSLLENVVYAYVLRYISRKLVQ